MIYNFDENLELEKIKENYNNIKSLKDSLADNAAEYRKFASDISLDFHVLKEFINEYEKTLLIDCFTFSEQLLKNTIYETLNFKGNQGIIDTFIQNKIHPEKFSPNVTYIKFSKELNNLNKNFQFLLSASHKSIKIYDEMIKSRHSYAHANNYPFKYDEYEDVIHVLEYLSWECLRFLSISSKSNHIQKLYKDILNSMKRIRVNDNVCIRNLPDNKKVHHKELKSNAKEFHNSFHNLTINITLLNCFTKNIRAISKADHRIVKEIEIKKLCVNTIKIYSS